MQQDLEATAFMNPDGSVATVMLNRSERLCSFQLVLNDTRWAIDLPVRSISTCVYEPQACPTAWWFTPLLGMSLTME